MGDGDDKAGHSDWDDGVFYARHHPILGPKLKSILAAEPELTPVAPFLEIVAKVSVQYRRCAREDYKQPGQTRFGGMPDLPAGLAYPRFSAQGSHGPVEYAYEFIAQIDCAEVAPLQDFLPRAGRLYFFLSTKHDLHGDVSLDYPVGIVWHDASPADALVPGSTLRHVPADYFDMDAGAYEAASCRAHKRASVMAPSFYSLHENERLFRPVLRQLGWGDDFFDDEHEVFERVDEVFDELLDEGVHYLGGYGYSHHEFPISQAAAARGGSPSDWQLLLTVRSRGTMQWGDGGDLHFVVHKGDLSRGDFSRIWVGTFDAL